MKNNDTVLVNRVANSKLKTINLENYFPEVEIIEFDIKSFLFQGLILREKEFRAQMKEIDWEQYRDQTVAIFCSTDAIVPTWAFMLVASYLAPYAAQVFMGNKSEYIESTYRERLAKIDYNQYEDELIVIKGCSNKAVPPSAYVDLTSRLTPVARSIMYGEACSTVPIYKKPKKR